MEFVWVLSICGGLSGWGCGSFKSTAMPSYEACAEARDKSFILPTVGEGSSGHDGNSGYAICRLVEVGQIDHIKHPKSWVITDN